MSIQDLINRTKAFNEKSFVNGQNELIIFPKINLFFRLDDVKNDLDFKCKVLEWCSREADKGCTYFYRLQARHYINYILNTEFTANQFQMIYCQLGNCIDHKLTVDFITSNYDLNLLVSPHCKECLGNCLKEAKL